MSFYNGFYISSNSLYGGGYLINNGLYPIPIGLDIFPCQDKMLHGWILDPDNPPDGTLVDQSTDGDARDSVMSRKIVGNGSLYGEFYNVDGTPQTIDLGTSHMIEFEAVLINNTNLLLGQTASFDSYIGTVGSPNVDLAYRVNGNSLLFPLTIDGVSKKYKFVRNNTSVTFYINDSQIGLPQTLPSNDNFSIDKLFIGNSSFQFEGECCYLAFGIDEANIIARWQDFSETIDATDNNQARTTDSQGLYEILWNNTYYNSDTDAWIVDSVLGATNDEATTTALADKIGVSFAKALGKNLFNGEFILDPLDTSRVVSTYFISVQPNTKYSLSNLNSYWNFIIWYDEDFNQISSVNDGGGGGLANQTSPSNVAWAKIRSAGGQGQDDLNARYQLEQNSSITDYELWTGYYRDPSLQVPYVDGQPLHPVQSTNGSFSATKCKGYVFDETQADDANLVQDVNGPAIDGVLVDSVGSSDFPATERYAGKKWDGDGSAYVDLASTVNLGTSHVIEFEAIARDNVTEIYLGLLGNTTDYIATLNTGSFRYRAGNQTADIAFTSTGVMTKYRIVRDNLDVELFQYISGVWTSIGSGTLGSNQDFEIDAIFAYSTPTLIFSSECSYISFGADENSLHTFPFEMKADSDIMNSIPPSGEEPITGTIVGNIGNLIKPDDSVEQFFNVLGGARAKALSNQLFNKDNLTNTNGYYDASGNFIVNVAWRTYRFLITNQTEISFLPVSGISPATVFFDENGNFIVGYANTASAGNVSIPSNAKYGIVSVVNTILNTYMLNEGSSVLPYEAWQGYYYDPLGLNPVPDGNVGIKTDDGTINFYVEVPD